MEVNCRACNTKLDGFSAVWIGGRPYCVGTCAVPCCRCEEMTPINEAARAGRWYVCPACKAFEAEEHRCYYCQRRLYARKRVIELGEGHLACRLCAFPCDGCREPIFRSRLRRYTPANGGTVGLCERCDMIRFVCHSCGSVLFQWHAFSFQDKNYCGCCWNYCVQCHRGLPAQEMIMVRGCLTCPDCAKLHKPNGRQVGFEFEFAGPSWDDLVDKLESLFDECDDNSVEVEIATLPFGMDADELEECARICADLGDGGEGYGLHIHVETDYPAMRAEALGRFAERHKKQMLAISGRFRGQEIRRWADFTSRLSSKYVAFNPRPDRIEVRFWGARTNVEHIMGAIGLSIAFVMAAEDTDDDDEVTWDAVGRALEKVPERFREYARRKLDAVVPQTQETRDDQPACV